MLRAGKDSAPVALSQTHPSKQSQPSSTGTTTATLPETTSLPAVQILNARGDFSASLGVIPPILRPFVTRYVPWFSNGNKAVKALAGLAVAAVERRLASESSSQNQNGNGNEKDNANANTKANAHEDDLDLDISLTDAHRTDLLAKLRSGKDEHGAPMGREELTAEALTQLIAGSDTTSNTSCAILYWCLKNPNVITKLQKELDDALPDNGVPTFNQVKDLP